MQDFLTVLYPVLLTFLTGFLGYVGKEIIKLVPKLVTFVIAKIGLTTYQKTKLVASDVWNIVEEHFRLSQVIGDTVQAKITMFETLIKQKVPKITDVQIHDFRQAIAGEVNKDKPIIIKAIEDPVTIATPIIKYYAADGVTELQPVTVIEQVATV